MTTKKMDAFDALEIYRRKEAVENSLNDLKNTLNMNRLRILSLTAMDSRLYLQFLELILLSGVRTVVKLRPILKRMGVREIMEQMESLVEVRYSGRYGSIIIETDPL